jgi:hypothetical protein
MFYCVDTGDPAGLKRGLLLFWAAWHTIVFTTNLLDAAKALGLLSEAWAFASGNWRFLVETTARYSTPGWLNGLLFLGVIAWEGLAAMLFWRAWLTQGSTEARRHLYTAFTTSLMLWATFLLADELYIAYPVEATHLRLFMAQLVTLLAIELLPARNPPTKP